MDIDPSLFSVDPEPGFCTFIKSTFTGALLSGLKPYIFDTTHSVLFIENKPVERVVAYIVYVQQHVHGKRLIPYCPYTFRIRWRLLSVRNIMENDCVTS
jgi:hypothetical protein